MKKRSGRDDTKPMATPTPTVLRTEDLSDRQVRGIQLHGRAEKSNGLATLLNDETTIYWGDRAYRVTRELRNVRGTLKLEYRCSCGDFRKNGRIDCLHCFAERLRRGEAIVEGAISGERHATAGGAVGRRGSGMPRTGALCVPSSARPALRSATASRRSSRTSSARTT